MFPLIFTLAVFAQNASTSTEVPVDASQIRESVEKSLAFLEKGGLEWEMTKCVSCHHGPWMMWSGYEAKRRGFTVNDESLEKVRVKSMTAYGSHPKMQPTNRDVLNDWSINVIYLIFGMGAAGEPNAETAKFFDQAAAHLIEHQKEDGSWKVFIEKAPDGLMAPLLDTDDVTTMWALLALHYREPSGISRKVLAESKARGLKFLNDKPPGDTLQSVVMRIMLAQRLGNKDGVQAHVKHLLSLQQDDGGWSQTKKLKSDALATGQALMALSTAGVTTKDPASAQARAYLLKNQKEDGSWFVVSRAYQAPEFSSYLGTAWATLALLRTLPELKDVQTSERPLLLVR
ncbi:MAG: hypothetical protein K8U03_03455 [Planctomycetia bacterium]|nr:hypothetical protein [Planctomycetia bacterium]